MCRVNDTAVGNDGMIEAGAADLCRWQHARASIDGFRVMEEVELRDVLGECKVGMKEGWDVSDVFPIAFVLVAGDLVLFDGLRNDLLAKVGGMAVFVEQNVEQQLTVEDVDTH